MPHDNPSSAETASAGAPSFAAAQETKRQRTRLIIRAVGMLPVLLLLCVGFHFLSDGRFFSGQNLGIVLQQAAVNTVLAAGMTFVILTGGIDLSVGSILAAAAMAGLIVSKFPDLGLFWLPAAVLAGLVFGVINGALIALLRLPPFIVTLGSLTAVRGLARLLSFGSALPSSTLACTCQSTSMRRSGKSLLRSGSRFMTSPWRGLMPFCENVDTRLRGA